MEPPTAKEEIKLKNSYTIVSDKNHSFSIIFQKFNSSIGIIGSYQDEIIKHSYQKNITFEELKKNKFLGICETIDEIYDELILLLNKNKTKILEETNQIFISIPVEMVKVKEILFVLDEITKNDSEKIEELFSIISNLKKEIKELKENKKSLEEDLKYLKEENNNKKEEIKNLKEKINLFESFTPYLEEYKKKSDDKKNNKIIINLDSLIIEDNEKYNMTLKNWINPNMKIKAELLYRMSRDGIEVQTFHNLCDNKGPTVIIAKLIDGYILGTYTPLDWDSTTNGSKSDSKMFVFSLTEKIKCLKNNKNNCGIYCGSNYGPYSYFLRFYKNDKMNKAYIVPQDGSFDESQKLYPGKNEGYYNTQEVEVYKIII